MAKRTDQNQRAIVAALRQVGCSVVSLHTHGRGIPDLLVGRAGKSLLLEVKGPKGTSTPDQIAWSEEWRGHLAIVRTPQEAIKAVTR